LPGIDSTVSTSTGAATAVNDPLTAPPPADAVSPTVPTIAGVTAVETTPVASAVNTHDAPPHAKVPPLAVMVTAAPAPGVPSPSTTLTTNDPEAATPTYPPLPGTETRLSTSGGIATAVNEALTLPPPADAVNTTRPAATGVTAVETTPEASAVNTHEAAPQAARIPFVAVTVTAAPAATVPSHNTAATRNAPCATLPGYPPLAGIAWTVNTSGGSEVAVNDAVAVPPTAAAASPTVPMAVGVTAVETMPEASAVTTHNANPHAPNVPPTAVSVTASPAAAVPSQRTVFTANGNDAGLPAIAPFDGADTTVNTSGESADVNVVCVADPPEDAASKIVPTTVGVTVVDTMP